jgi:hypothetical protein
MKLLRNYKKGISIILTPMLTSLVLCSYAQLPEDYVTKVSYHEKKEVIYSLPSEGDLGCLSLAELSQYHGYMQFYSIDEYIDTEGDLLTDQNFIEEQHVRDEWMEGYSRITVGKKSIDVYGLESGLISRTPREPDSNDVFLTAEESEKFGFFDLNLAYYDKVVAELIALGLELVEQNQFVTASNPFITISYDHNGKIASATEYDSSGLKTKESIIQYSLNEEENTYFPETETTIEWFLGKNGCCIRKTTIITRYGYHREMVQGSNPTLEESNEDKLQKRNLDKSDFEISVEKNRNVFRIESGRILRRKLDVVVYDMAGKMVMRKKVGIGEAIHMPATSRTGMYLVHILSDKKGHPVTGKIIMSGNGKQF